LPVQAAGNENINAIPITVLADENINNVAN
jgi:hypothetical protein